MTTHELTLFVSGIAIGAFYTLLLGIVAGLFMAEGDEHAR